MKSKLECDFNQIKKQIKTKENNPTKPESEVHKLNQL